MLVLPRTIIGPPGPYWVAGSEIDKTDDPDACFLRCWYCGEIFPQVMPTGSAELRHDQHEHGCAVPLPDPDECPADFPCYCCGTLEADAISSSQRRKYGGAARCRECVSCDKCKRVRRPDLVCTNEPASLGEQLHRAVIKADAQAVRALLLAGADPNHRRQIIVFDCATRPL